MDEGNRRDLQIHGTDANALLAKTLESGSRLIIKEYDLPTRKKVK